MWAATIGEASIAEFRNEILILPLPSHFHFPLLHPHLACIFYNLGLLNLVNHSGINTTQLRSSKPLLLLLLLADFEEEKVGAARWLDHEHDRSFFSNLCTVCTCINRQHLAGTTQSHRRRHLTARMHAMYSFTTGLSLLSVKPPWLKARVLAILSPWFVASWNADETLLLFFQTPKVRGSPPFGFFCSLGAPRRELPLNFLCISFSLSDTLSFRIRNELLSLYCFWNSPELPLFLYSRFSSKTECLSLSAVSL